MEGLNWEPSCLGLNLGPKFSRWVPDQAHPQSCLTPYSPMDYSQAPLSMGLSRLEYWSELPFPPPGDLPNPGIKPMSSVVRVLAGIFFTTEPPGKPCGPNDFILNDWQTQKRHITYNKE